MKLLPHIGQFVGSLLIMLGAWSLAATRADDTLAPQVIDAERARIDAIAAASAASVGVFGPGASGGGSGVVIAPDGYALTNFHVVQPSGDYMQCTMPDGVLYDAVVVGVDPTGDVALIRLLGREDFPVAKLGDSDQLRPGDWCFTVGNPFLLATDFQPSVAYGIVSGVHRYQYPAGTLLEYADCIQTDAAINPGNSGGPLFNERGELIGINGRGSFEKRGRVNVGVGYAISINQIKKFLGYLRSGRIVDHATLGATVTSDESGAAIVSNILDSSDAYRRGLRYNDEIVSLGNRLIDSPNTLKNVLGTYPQGWRIPLSYRREGKRYDVLVRLSGVHGVEELISKATGAPTEPPQPEKPEKPQPEQPSEPEDAEGQGKGEQEGLEEGQDESPPAPHEDPNTPRPLRRLREMLRRPKMPEHVARQFESRRGFANYYFNKLNRDRVWQNFGAEPIATPSATTGNETRSPEWVVRGELATGEKVEITLRDREAFLDWPEGPKRLDLTADLQSLIRQRLLLDGRIVEDIGMDHSLLLAFALWRQLLVDGPGRFGDVVYWGTAPLQHREELVDVLVGTRDVVETRFWFAPESGGMVGLEAFYEVGSDPVELYFHEPTRLPSPRIANEITVRLGDESLELKGLTVTISENAN